MLFLYSCTMNLCLHTVNLYLCAMNLCLRAENRKIDLIKKHLYPMPTRQKSLQKCNKYKKIKIFLDEYENFSYLCNRIFEYYTIVN